MEEEDADEEQLEDEEPRRQIPQAIHLYNHSMGGVDLGDQLLQEYSPNLRSVKLWKKMLINFLVTTTGDFVSREIKGWGR